MRVLVTGGAGMLGRQIVRELREEGHTVRVLSHREAGSELPAGIEWARADLAAGEGLREAVAGVDAIVHAATRFSPGGQEHLPSVDVDGTRALVRAASEVGVSHLLYVSIVGIEHFPRFTYYRWKVQAEELVRAGDVPWTIVRATQFYPFIGVLADALLRLPVVPVPARTLLQPVAAADVGACIAKRIAFGSSRSTLEIAGPDVITAADLMRSLARARGQRRLVVPLPLPGRFGAALRAGALTSPHGEHGTHTWAEWLYSDARDREIAEYQQRDRDTRREIGRAARDAAGPREARRGALAGGRIMG